MYQLLEDYYAAWDALSVVGKCDKAGRAEYKRCLEAFIETVAGGWIPKEPKELLLWIVKNANVPSKKKRNRRPYTTREEGRHYPETPSESPPTPSG